MKYAYKITDIDALAAAYPDAVVTVRSVNRAELGKIIRAAKVLKQDIAGVDVVDLPTIPEVAATEKTAKSFIAEKMEA